MSQKDSIFDGFEQSNTTPVPDILFDKLLVELSGAELKVLMYIIRRTAGFKKTEDAISLTQFEKGITTREGKKLDCGCGIKRRQTIVDALASLEKRGYIVSHKTKTSEKDNATTVYQIHFRGVVSKPYHLSELGGSFKTVPPSFNSGLGGVVAETVPPVVSKPDPQETVLQQTERKNECDPTSAISNEDESYIPSSAPSLSFSADPSPELSPPSVDNQASSVDKMPVVQDDHIAKPTIPETTHENGEQHNSVESVTTGNTSQGVYNCAIRQEPTLTADEQGPYDLWCQLPFIKVPPRITATVKKHCKTLAPHTQTLEDMVSLEAFARKEHKLADDKLTQLGNLANPDCLNGWLKKKSPSVICFQEKQKLKTAKQANDEWVASLKADPWK